MGDTRKTFALLLTIIAITSLVILPLRNVKADTDYTNLNGNLIMISPNSNSTYFGNMSLTFTINLTENAPVPWFTLNEIGYTIDNNAPIRLPIPISQQGCINFESGSDIIPVNEIGLVDISSLANGTHELRVFANGVCDVDNDGIFSWNTSLPPVNFLVGNLPPPSIVSFFPKNSSYISNGTLSSIPLNFSVDKTTSWIGYSLDNQGNITLTGNATLTGLAYGNHTIEIFANNTVGDMGASQIVSFSVEKSPPTETTESNITIATITVSVVIICLAAGLLLYRRHRKKH